MKYKGEHEVDGEPYYFEITQGRNGRGRLFRQNPDGNFEERLKVSVYDLKERETPSLFRLYSKKKIGEFSIPNISIEDTFEEVRKGIESVVRNIKSMDARIKGVRQATLLP